MKFGFVAPFWLLAVSSLFAQTQGGSILGTITDSQGAVVVGARVEVRNADTNTASPLVTNSRGVYEVRSLIPGNYQVTAEASGFKKLVRTGIVLQLGDELFIDLKLEVGATSDSVTVAATTPILETDSVSTGRSMTTRELMTLPVLSNDIVVQAMLAAGAQSNGLNGYVTQGQVNGSSQPYYAAGNVGGSEWSIDGAPNNGNTRRTGYTPDTDTVEEFRVETSNFDASIGHTTGLSVQMQSKSGTNTYHGTASDDYWNTRLNAAGFYQKQAFYQSIASANAAGNTTLANQLASGPTTPGGHSNNYAGTFGGPVWIPKVYNGKNKLFFFISFAGAKDRQPARPANINYTVPTASERTGNFSDLLPFGVQYTVYDPLTVQPDPTRPGHYVRTPFPGNIIPSSRVGASDSALLNFVNQYMPLPNNNLNNPTASPNYIATCQIDNSDYHAIDQKTDYQMGSNNRFSVRWNYSHYFEPQGDYTCTGLQSGDEVRIQKGVVATWTHTFNSSTVLDITGSFTSFIDRFTYIDQHKYNPTTVGLPSYLQRQCEAQDNSCELPNISISGYQSIGAGGAGFPYDRTENVKANLSHVRGKHTLRAGIEFRDQIHDDAGTPGNSSGNPSFNNTYTRKDDDGSAPNSSLGLSWAALELGIPSTISQDNNTSQTLTNPYYGWYGQDNWRVSSTLSVTLGFRMEYELGPTDRYNRLVTSFNPTAALPIAAIAQAAYASVTQATAILPASAFNVVGGNLYAGVNGASRKVWQNELMYMPRLSVAWHFDPKTVFRAGYGTYYDTANVNNDGVNQGGYSITTTTTTSTTFGQTWNAGNPAAGISPLSDPFPVQASGSRFLQPFGNSLGSMYEAGRGYTFDDYNRKHQYVQKWRAGFQREVGRNMVFEAAYWGQWGSDLNVTDNLSTLGPQYYNTTETRNLTPGNIYNANVTNPFYINNYASFATSNPTLYRELNSLSFFTSPTVALNKLLTPFPQMNGLSEAFLPYGRDQIAAVELNFTKRFSSGFNFNTSYTWMHARDKLTINNPYDTYPIWEPSNSSRPRRLTMSGIYEFPFGKGRHLLNKGGIVGQAVGGWEVSGTYQYQPGDLIGFGNDFYTGNLNNLRNELENGCVPACNQINSWFNTSNFVTNSSLQPGAYQVRVFPYYVDGVRGDKQSIVNANLLRNFKIREKVTFQLRLDAANLQNRSQFSDPTTSPTSSTFGKVTGQTVTPNRFYDLQARIQF